MKFASTLMIMGVCTYLSAAAFAQETAPATEPSATTQPMVAPSTQPMAGEVAPSTQPAFVADQTTPLGTAFLLTRALTKGDPELVADLMVADPLQIQYVQGIATMSKGLRELYDASLEKYGSDVELLEITAPDDTAEKNVMASKVEEEGDKAMIMIPGSPVGMPLVKVDGKWHVDMSPLISPSDMTSSTPLLTTLGTVASKTAAEIRAGKYADIGAVQASLKAQMNAISAKAQQAAPAVNAPTTTPAEDMAAPAVDAPAPAAPAAPEMSAPAEVPAAPTAPEMPAAPASQPM